MLLTCDFGHMFGLFNFNEMPDEATSKYIWCSDCHWLLMSYEMNE
jgi:hypothetical protein